MACPAVAGLVAVILQISEEEGLDLNPAEVKELLRENSEPKGRHLNQIFRILGMRNMDLE